jgi:hypothetical protein
LKHVSEIVEKYSKKRLTRSTKYLFPLLYDGFNVIASNVTNLQQNGFEMVNLYIGDWEKHDASNFENNLNKIFMLLYVQDFENDNFKLFFEDVKHHSLYFEYYNVDVNYIMIVFKLDEDGSSIYRNFRRGEYSKFPEKYKNIFQNSFEAPLNSAYNVIIKNPLLRHKLEQDLDIQLPINAELDDKPYLNEEIFRYDNN